jgi:antitoxin component of MazEF toxin-antitoxin module
MIKTITKIGNSKGIIFDAALLELANLKEGDKLNVTVHEGGTITLVPDVVTADDSTFQDALDGALVSHSETLTKLS